jgi:N-acetylmuramoyl-L-alanine amidase
VGEEAGPANRRDPAADKPAAAPATADAAPAVDALPGRRVGPIDPPATRSKPSSRKPPPWQVVVEGTAPARRAPAPTPAPPSPNAEPAEVARNLPVEPSPPAAPQTNRAGSYSLVRQLGLGARKIVIDAGHGGHDPGSIGRGGLQEKDLVLDVALRLEKMVRAELGAEVVMTRSTDVFIPLEERTAIANSRGADLFLSIHANSSRNPRARGVETYFLNFAADPHAEEVAARENAISAATLKDLQNLVKAIALNAKIDESRDFAASVQEAMVRTQREHQPGVPDRGVRTAPFYVLIGANMPSVLAEIAFVSHPGEEKLLRTGDHRDRIARSLFQGVKSYLEALNRTQMRQLTGSSRRSTVAAKGARR